MKVRCRYCNQDVDAVVYPDVPARVTRHYAGSDSMFAGRLTQAVCLGSGVRFDPTFVPSAVDSTPAAGPGRPTRDPTP